MKAAGLLERASSRRHGIVRPATDIPLGGADLPGVFHASVADGGDRSRLQDRETDALRSAGGGVARTPQGARIAAMAEALERYAAGTALVPTRRRNEIHEPVLDIADWSLHSADQRADPAFPDPTSYPTDPHYTPVRDLIDNGVVWVPAALVALRRDHGTLATSSGLAADFSPLRALLRAVQELVERDAYVTTWVHGIAPRRIRATAFDDEVAAIGGRLGLYDITPAYSPHPVACVAGSMPLRGRPRNSLGLACRGTWAEAAEKAFLEFVQGTMFVGHHLALHPELEALRPETCTDFDRHAVYWTVERRTTWWDLPIHAASTMHEPPDETADAHAGVEHGAIDAAELTHLTHRLHDEGIRLAYAMLPTAGLDQIGLRVVRALSPDLTPLHHDHNWPFLGGSAADLPRRFPDAVSLTGFPSPHPHALG